MHRAALILTRQSLFVFSFLHLLTVAGYHFENWNQMGPFGPRCIFSLGRCMFAYLTHKYSRVCHASDFLAKTTRLCFLSYLFCASTTRWWDTPRLSSALFPATCCLLILTPASRSLLGLPSTRKSHGSNLWELLKSSHVVWETCQCVCCVHWPDLGWEERPNKMAYLPLFCRQLLGNYDSTETSGNTNF